MDPVERALRRSIRRGVRRVLKPASRIGRTGETRIANQLGMLAFFGREGRTLRNVYVTNSKGYTAEIDVLYITAKGLFVIESKNYSGWIFGDDRNAMWTATYYAGKNFIGVKKSSKHKFYNPVWQNQGHIRFLKRFLNMRVPCYSFVVFSDQCEFKALELNNDDTIVCKRRQLRAHIKRIWDSSEDLLTQEQIDKIYKRLLPLTNPDQEVRAKHIASIQRRINQTERCPKCGRKLVTRTAKKGYNAGKEFIGCSGYPQCDFTRRLK